MAASLLAGDALGATCPTAGMAITPAKKAVAHVKGFGRIFGFIAL
jgi:hypothetical protein